MTTPTKLKVKQMALGSAIPAATFAIDAVTNHVITSDVNSSTWAHTNTAGDLIYVLVAINSGITPTATYGDDAMEMIGSTAGNYIFRLKKPKTGANNVVISLTSTSYILAWAITFVGGNLWNPNSKPVSATGTSTNPSVAVPSQTSDFVIDIMRGTGGSATAVVITVGAGQTERMNNGNPGWLFGAGSSEPGATSVTMDWTLGVSHAWEILATSIHYQ